MCCSSQRTFCGSKSGGINSIVESRASPPGQTRSQSLHYPTRGSSIFFQKSEGDCRAFSFYQQEANLDWIQSLPPRRCACVHLGTKGPWLATFLHRDSGFHFKSSASPRGRATRRFFCLCALLVWGRASREPALSLPKPRAKPRGKSKGPSRAQLGTCPLPLPNKRVKHPRSFKSNALIERDGPVVSLSHRQRDEMKSTPTQILG